MRHFRAAAFSLGCILWALPALGREAAESPGYPWVSLLNLLVLIAILVIFGRKGLRDYLRGRRAEVADAVAEAEQLRMRAEAMAMAYRLKLEQLEQEMEQILKEAREAGERERQRMLEWARGSAERIRQDAERTGEAERERVRKKLEAEILAAAAARAEGVLRSRVTEEDHRLFTQELIARLEETHGPGR